MRVEATAEITRRKTVPLVAAMEKGLVDVDSAPDPVQRSRAVMKRRGETEGGGRLQREWLAASFAPAGRTEASRRPRRETGERENGHTT